VSKNVPIRGSEVVLLIVGSFILRAAAAGSAELIAFYLADLEHVDVDLRGSFIIGRATMLFYVAEVVGALIFGALTDKHGPRRYILMGPLYGGVASAVMAIVAAIPTVIGARFFQGLSTGAAIPATLAFLSRYCGDDEAKRGRIMSIFEISAISGMAFGFIVVGAIWDSVGLVAFIPMTALYALSFVLLWRVGRGTWTSTGERHIQMGFLRSRQAMRLVPAWISVNAILGIWLTHSALQLKRPDDPSQLLVGGYSGTQISFYGATMLLLFVTGIGIWGWLMVRLGSVRVMALSLFGLVGLCPALLLLNHSSPGDRLMIGVWLIVSIVALVVGSGFTPAALAYLSRIAEEHGTARGAIMGVYSVLLGVGQALGSITGGELAGRFGVDGMIALSLVYAGIACAAVAALIRSDRGWVRVLAERKISATPAAGSSPAAVD
jgi:MFS family permease